MIKIWRGFSYVIGRVLWPFREVILSPLYATILTLLVLFSGGLASLYSDDIKSAWPINYSATHGWSWHAFLAWAFSLASALIFFVREYIDSIETKKGQKTLFRQAKNLERLVRTLPPANFLSTFAETHGI